MPSALEFILSHLPTLTVLGAIGLAIAKVLERKSHLQSARDFLDRARALQADQPQSLHPEIDPELCSGCGACTTACPEGDILQMVEHKAVLVMPGKCVGHGECERACPMNAIKLVFGTKTRGVEIPRLSVNYETNLPGVYIAGELGGMGLIRNAVKQGVLASDHAVQNLGAGDAQFDVVIVGSGPAGFAAALNVLAAGKRYLLIEQNTFGGTISNFPRQKLVMTHPFELPIAGRQSFDKNTVSKEEILAYWNSVKAKTGLKIHEGVKFENLKKSDKGFVVKTSVGEVITKKVILAMGVRGSARKLGIEGEELEKVTYSLADADQYKNQRIVIVGGGNAAAETAQALCRADLKNRVYMLVRGRGLDRCNSTNEKMIQSLAQQGRLALWFESSVKKIEKERVIVSSGKEMKAIKNDYVLILAGSEMPRQFLMSLGVQMQKKFGEGA